MGLGDFLKDLGDIAKGTYDEEIARLERERKEAQKKGDYIKVAEIENKMRRIRMEKALNK